MLATQVTTARARPLKAPLALLDVGTTKIVCLIARPRPGGRFIALGQSYQRAEGFRGGDVVDADDAETSILAALQEAEMGAGEQLREVAVVWSGGAPRTRRVAVSIPLHGRPVHDEDLREGLEAARAEGRSEGGREVLHVVPIETHIDKGRPLRDPRGMAGETLDLTLAVVTVAARPLHDLLDCLRRCHLRVTEIVAATYAAAIGCLSADEAERGCLVLDMGGGGTGFCLFHAGRLIFLDRCRYGGDLVTHDIAQGLGVSHAFAERLKTLYGGVQMRSCDDNMRLAIRRVGAAPQGEVGEVPRRYLTHIARLRVEEILADVMTRLGASGALEGARPRGVVVTGGAAQIEGVIELVEEVGGLPARLGACGLVETRSGPETRLCCTAGGGGLALLAGHDDGLGWKESDKPLAGGIARIGQWLKQNFAA